MVLRGARTLVGTLGVLVMAGMLGAACSSTTSHPAANRPTTSTSKRPATSGPSASSPTSSAPISSSSSSSSSTSTTDTSCSATELTGSVSGTEGGAGVLETTVLLRNTGTTVCTLDGYPGLLLLGSGGTQLATNARDGGSLAFESVAPSLVSVAPGGDAYFNIGYSEVPSGGEATCPSATGLQVTPPGGTTHLVVPVHMAPCAGGQLHESAVFGPGSAGAQTAVPSTTGS